MTFREQLVELDACYESLEWVGNKSLKESWETCENIYWMIWILSKTDLDLVDPICDIADGVLHLVQEDKRLACSNAISAVRRRANKDELDAAYIAAYNEYTASDAAYAAYCAIYSCIRYASRTATADNVAYYASRARGATAAAAAAANCNATARDADTSVFDSAAAAAEAAGNAAETNNGKNQCDVIRKYFTIDQVREAFNKLVA